MNEIDLKSIKELIGKGYNHPPALSGDFIFHTYSGFWNVDDISI
jgi:hypothetical protein